MAGRILVIAGDKSTCSYSGVDEVRSPAEAERIWASMVAHSSLAILQGYLYPGLEVGSGSVGRRCTGWAADYTVVAEAVG